MFVDVALRPAGGHEVPRYHNDRFNFISFWKVADYGNDARPFVDLRQISAYRFGAGSL
jgi:hypothetical protein